MLPGTLEFLHEIISATDALNWLAFKSNNRIMNPDGKLCVDVAKLGAVIMKKVLVSMVERFWLGDVQVLWII